MFTRSSPLVFFPVYLLPPSPFRRRKQSTDSTDSAASIDSADSTIRRPRAYLKSHISHLRCAKCATDICLTSQIISKGFTGRHGRAYLISPSPSSRVNSRTAQLNKTLCLPNTKTDPPSSRQLVTGAHTVSDVRCAFCNSMLGWKYDEAEEESQRYKVGKYILETKMVCSSSDWENGELDMPPACLKDKDLSGSREGVVEFDSQDEDECEDLFAGVWNPVLALKRRQGSAFRRPISGATAETDRRY